MNKEYEFMINDDLYHDEYDKKIKMLTLIAKAGMNESDFNKLIEWQLKNYSNKVDEYINDLQELMNRFDI